MEAYVLVKQTFCNDIVWIEFIFFLLGIWLRFVIIYVEMKQVLFICFVWINSIFVFFGVNWRFEFIFWRLYFVGGCRVCSFFFFRLIMFVDYVYKVGIVFCFVSLANVFIYRRFLVCLKRIKFVSEGFKIFYRVILFI